METVMEDQAETLRLLMKDKNRFEETQEAVPIRLAERPENQNHHRHQREGRRRQTNVATNMAITYGQMGKKVILTTPISEWRTLTS